MTKRTKKSATKRSTKSVRRPAKRAPRKLKRTSKVYLDKIVTLM